MRAAWPAHSNHAVTSDTKLTSCRLEQRLDLGGGVAGKRLLGELVALAHTTGKSVCSLHSDTLTDEDPTYLDLMVFNTRSIKSCLDPASLPAWPFESEASIPNPTRGDQ